MIALTIHPFGAFRAHGTLSLRLPSGSAVEDVKEALVQQLGENTRALVESAALADEGRILPPHHVFRTSAHLSILPPVCGG